MDYVSWRKSLQKDADILELLTLMVGDITPEHDLKLQELLKIIDDKINHPINEGNKKIIIFTAFADTAGYLYDNVSTYVKTKYGLNTAMVSGMVEGRTTCPNLKKDLNTVLTCFSPISKDKKLLMPNDDTEMICSLQLTVFQKVRIYRIAITLLTMIYIGIRSHHSAIWTN